MYRTIRQMAALTITLSAKP